MSATADEGFMASLASLACDVSNASAGHQASPANFLVATHAVLVKAGRRSPNPEALAALAVAAFGAEPDGTRRWRSFVEVVLAGSAERGSGAAMTAADRAVNHVLNRNQTDPDVRHLFSSLTESFELLCAAEAERTGEPVEAVKARRKVCAQPAYRRREPEVVRLERLLDRYVEKFGELEGES